MIKIITDILIDCFIVIIFIELIIRLKVVNKIKDQIKIFQKIIEIIINKKNIDNDLSKNYFFLSKKLIYLSLQILITVIFSFVIIFQIRPSLVTELNNVKALLSMSVLLFFLNLFILSLYSCSSEVIFLLFIISFSILILNELYRIA